jgi:hypothetical protein
VDDDADGRVLCATYTHARRHPMVLGKIGDWTPPFQLTMAQLVVLVVVLLVQVRTWRWWGARLDPIVAIAIFISLPTGLAWAVRKARIEGRSLPRAVVGWMAYLARPRTGRVAGRTYRAARPAVLTIHRTYVTQLPPPSATGAPSAAPAVERRAGRPLDRLRGAGR